MSYRVLLFTLLASLLNPACRADSVYVAAAGNFTATLQQLAPLFEQQSGHQLKISYGSTGKLYAQIVQGAPFDVFLAADQLRPQQLVDAKLAEPASRFTYAVGRLVLWSTRQDFVDQEGLVLRQGNFRHLAIANPKTAPYGLAALEVLRTLQLEETLRPRLVVGDNIAQAHQFVFSGNAELGFIAAAQLHSMTPAPGSWWIIPAHLHHEIRQDAILLSTTTHRQAGEDFLVFLASPAVQAMINNQGYGITAAGETRP